LSSFFCAGDSFDLPACFAPSGGQFVGCPGQGRQVGLSVDRGQFPVEGGGFLGGEGALVPAHGSQRGGEDGERASRAGQMAGPVELDQLTSQCDSFLCACLSCAAFLIQRPNPRIALGRWVPWSLTGLPARTDFSAGGRMSSRGPAL